MILEPDSLQSLAVSFGPLHRDAEPFPHSVIDGFLPSDVLRAVIAEFPGPDDITWKHHRHRHSEKLACGDELAMGPVTRQLIWELNSAPMVRFLEQLTGIVGLIPDPLLVGGGLHRIERGGHLGVHADFNLHPEWNLDRRLNLLIYLNEGWKDDYGGHLEIWSRDMAQCVEKILPVANRCVIFNTSDHSFHGHPVPLTCPEGQSRKSIALYYYSNGRPEEEKSESHSTLYQERPTRRGTELMRKWKLRHGG